MVTLSAFSAICCRCRSSCSPRPRSSPPPPTSRRAQFRAQARAGLSGGARLRSRDGGAARVRQRRRRLRRQRQSSDRERRWTTRTSSPRPTRAARASPTAARGPRCSSALLKSVLADVDLAYQNLDSVELGVTTVDIISTRSAASAARCARQRRRPRRRSTSAIRPRAGKVRTLSEQVALETRTRMLNPKWYEGMLKHGYEGVRQIERTSPTPWAGRRPPGRSSPGSISRSPRPSCSTRDARAARRRSIRRPRPRWPTACIEAHERGYWQPDAQMLAALRAPATNWKTASKAYLGAAA
jgi:hypothetical protein